MGIRWDALLVREVARELNTRLARVRLRAVRFDGKTRDAVFFFRDTTVVWRLHPNRGTVHFTEPKEPGPDAFPLAARVRRVYSPPDERLIILELLPVRGRRPPSDIVVELLGNQWNCVIAEQESRILRHVLHTRTGKRLLRVGQPYEPPTPSDRLGADGLLSRAHWDEVLAAVPPNERRRSLIARVAWTSPLNAESILTADSADATDTYETWKHWVAGPHDRPVVLQLDRGAQPYPFALAGETAEPVASLLHALDVAVPSESEGAEETLLDPAVLRRLDKALEVAERRLTSLVAEVDALEDEDELRAMGDLILARYHEIPSGAARATIADFEGNSVVVDLEPGAAAHENAAAYYDRAAKTGRARERLPELIQKAETDTARYRGLLDQVRAGTVTSDAVATQLPALRATQSTPTEEVLPYRRYQSSGGLEIRVGRGAKHNDALTFRHSAPNDVWLHARHSAGAHVVLRWNGPGNAPARDLEEAAVLAALHSKARTSGSVPVDYTLRKYVRKPRKAAAGAVLPDRVKTLFVEPDPALAERLLAE